MGRYLSNGILTSIFIEKRKGFHFGMDQDFDLKKEIENVLKDMNRIIDVSKYDMTEKGDEFILNLKLDFMNENIHDLLKEINDLTPSVYFFERFYNYDEALKIDYNDPDFKKKYPLLCTIEDDYYTIKCNDETTKEDCMFDNFYWIIDNEYLRKNITVSGAVIPLWLDWNKYIGEDQTPMLRIINNMKATYYHSELSKVLIYEIFG